MKLNGANQLLVYVDINLMGESIHAMNTNTEVLLVASKETGLEKC
jgi:hypothetical protein